MIHVHIRVMHWLYSGTSLIRPPTGLAKSELNEEVTILQGILFTVEYRLGLSKGDRSGEVTLRVRFHWIHCIDFKLLPVTPAFVRANSPIIGDHGITVSMFLFKVMPAAHMHSKWKYTQSVHVLSCIIHDINKLLSQGNSFLTITSPAQTATLMSS